jgi:hypothetical protein
MGVIYLFACHEHDNRYNAPPDEATLTELSEPQRSQMLFNNQMKTDVWALVGIVVTTIQMQQVNH